MTSFLKEYKKAFPEGIVREILKGIELAEKETRRKLTAGGMGMFEAYFKDDNTLKEIILIKKEK